MDLVHYSKIAPGKEVLEWRTFLIEICQFFGSFLPSFCVANVPQNIVILNLMEDFFQNKSVKLKSKRVCNRK